MDQCKEPILSEMYRDFIVSTSQKELFAEVFPAGVCRQEIGTFYEALYVGGDLAEPILLERYPYDSIPKCYTLLDMNAMEDTGILRVQNFPGLQLQGSGVLIGFVDTGIAWESEVFRNLDGSSRILGMWDQTIQSGVPPEGFSYGTEYRKEMLDAALKSEMPGEIVLSRDVDGHGTFLASLAAGGVMEEQGFIGAAPDAALAVVKLKPAKQYLKDFYLIEGTSPCYQENDIMLGIRYLDLLAEELGMPLVICIALGTNQGSHSGSSPLAGLIDLLTNRANRAVVIAAGNEANERHHYLGGTGNAGKEEIAELRVAEGVDGFVMELWANPGNIYAIAIQSPSGEKTYSFPVRKEQTEVYTFVLERTRVAVDYKLFTERLDAELVFVRFQMPSPGIWKIFAEPILETGEGFHIWLPVKEFLGGEVYFLESNPDTTVTEPGSALTGITVGFYNGNDNSVAIPSGRGYTRSRRIKPDFAAPGVNVMGLSGSGRFIERTGSSIAAGIASGAAALLMEWSVYRLQETIDATQIRNLLVLGTERRADQSYPNKEWGYGTLDVYHTFEVLRQI